MARRLGAGWRRSVRLIGLALFIIGGLGSAGAGLIQRLTYAAGPLAQPRDVVVPRGDTSRLAAALAAEGVVARAWQLRLIALVTHADGRLHAGEFAFPARASLADVLMILRTARPVEHRLTIPEGLTARQIAPLLAAAAAAGGPTPAIAEGGVLPQTYLYERGTTRAALLERAAGALAHALDTAWAARLPDGAIGSPRAALILASMIERETARPEERPHIAAVFLNRLHLGMKLQSDPTVVYAASQGAGVLDHRLTRAELDADDPYNTYQTAGLPPGPICAPGLDAITAALHPAASDDLFFVADGSGGHVFARGLAEHQRNAARLRALTPAVHGSAATGP